MFLAVLSVSFLTYILGLFLLNKLDDVVAAVEMQTTVVGGVVTLLKSLKDAVDAAKGDQTKIDAIFNGVFANTQVLSDAVTANTPANGNP